MAKFFVLLAVVCALHMGSARVVRDAPNPPTLTELTKQAEEALGTLHTKFLEFVGVRSDQELTTAVQDQSKIFANKLQEYANKLGEDAKENAGKADDFFKTFQTRLTGVIDEMKTKNPEFFNDAEKFQQNFQDNLKTVVKDTEELNKKLKDEGKVLSANAEQVLKQIYDSTVEAAQKVVTEIETVTKDKKTK